MRHIFLLLFIIPLLSLSHSGGTDSRGGHNDNINGGYHYHHGCSAHSHSGGCPYDYENCRNTGSRSSYKSKSNKYILWYIIGGFVLFIFVLYLYGEYIRYREKKRILKEQRLEKDKRHKTFLNLKRKQFNQNDEYISNQLTADQTLKFNTLKNEFEPKPKDNVINKPLRPKGFNSPYRYLGPVLIVVISLAFWFYFMKPTAADYYKEGIKARKKENYKEAISEFNKALDLNSNYKDALFQRAYTKEKLDKNNEAILDLDKAIELDPEYKIAYYNRGILKKKIKDYKGAISDYNKAIELDSGYKFAYHNRGFVKIKIKDYKGAISDFNKAINIDSNFAGAYMSKGYLKDELKNYKGAISEYNKGIKLDSNNSTSYWNRGVSKEKLGDLKGACEDWRKAASIGHKSAIFWVKRQCD